MLNGVHFHGTFSESSGALYGLDLADISIDEWLVWEIDSAEFKSMISRSWLDGERDFLSSVQRCSL